MFPAGGELARPVGRDLSLRRVEDHAAWDALLTRAVKGLGFRALGFRGAGFGFLGSLALGVIVTRAQAEFLEVFWVRGFGGVLGFRMISWGFGFWVRIGASRVCMRVS